MFFPESDVVMSEEEFRLIRDIVYSHCGLFFDNDTKYLLEKRLSRRLQLLQLQGFKDYYQFLKYDRKKDQELSDLMDILTTNETYFFREAFQLKALTDEILPELMAEKERKGEKSLRIWSAGCSTGEEPYTIAMLLMEMGCFQGLAGGNRRDGYQPQGSATFAESGVREIVIPNHRRALYQAVFSGTGRGPEGQRRGSGTCNDQPS